MGFVPEVKCPRCDRRYSALRARCPYCGTYRHRRTKKTAEADNATWKMVVGGALLVVLAVAVITLTADANKTKTAQAEAAAKKEQEIIDASLEKSVETLAKEADDFVDSQKPPEGEDTENGEGEEGTEQVPIPEIPVETVKLFINGKELTAYKGDDYDYDISVGLAASYTLSFTVVPESRMADVTATWTCTDQSILAVMQSGKITGLSRGTAYLYCKVENAEASVVVRVG